MHTSAIFMLQLFAFVKCRPTSETDVQLSTASSTDLAAPESGVSRRQVEAATNTFHVESLDSPIERIEIRLIDDNRTHPGIDEVVVVVDHHATVAPPPPTKPSHEYYPVYPSTLKPSPGDLAPSPSQAELISAEGPAAPAPNRTDSEGLDMFSEDFSRKPSYPSLPPAPAEIDDLTKNVDIIEGKESDEDDEPVEECLANRQFFTALKVAAMTERAENLRRKIRKLNKLVRQYCQSEQPHRQCPKWRDDKMVHYYKFMRVTYCGDVEKWPNSPRFKRTYKERLPLFETLYAFNQQ